MPLDLVIGEGSVGDVLSYMTREVPGEQVPLGKTELKRRMCRTNVILCRDCPDSGNNNEVAPGSEVAFEGEPELEIAKTQGCIHEGCGKEGLN